MKKWQKGIAEVLEETGRTQNPGICMKMVNWVLQQQGIEIFEIWQNFTPFRFFEKQSILQFRQFQKFILAQI